MKYLNVAGKCCICKRHDVMYRMKPVLFTLIVKHPLLPSFNATGQFTT